MGLLANGLETIELGSTAWRIIINANIEELYTKDEINNRVVDVTTTKDHTFSVSTKGPILVDRTTSTQYRLYVDNGVLSIEPVV